MNNNTINIKDLNYNIGLQICEDLWDDNYDRKLSAELIEHNPDLIINISASPFAQDRKEERVNLVKRKFKDAHPWFFGCQFHPEFTSNPKDAHPLFTSFINAAIKFNQKGL